MEITFAEKAQRLFRLLHGLAVVAGIVELARFIQQGFCFLLIGARELSGSEKVFSFFD